MTASIETVLQELNPRRIEAHLRFLADPLLEGRGAGSRGGRLAEEYIRAVLAAAGLDPVGDGGYRQHVPMIGMDPHPRLSFALPAGEHRTPGYRDEFVLTAGLAEPDVEIDADLVFAGFGIHAPEFDWDDFGDTDVAGKVLLVRVNEPGTPDRPDFFGGRALTYYGRWTYKFEEAARRGAAGALLIHTDESAGYGWNVVRSSNTGEQYGLAGSPRFPLPVHGWVTESFARELLGAGGGDAEAILRESERPGFRARRAAVRVSASVRSTIRDVSTANVFGIAAGTDPERAAEPIILMAHHDHLGVTTGEDGNPIVYPGAHDNASGVALILAMAHALAAAGARFPRPLLFLASTAEESGLLGSQWYASHPAFPLRRTAAVLNVDGANLRGPTKDIAPLGVDRSSLGDVVREAAEAEGLAVAPEQHPEQGSFFRQDHFPFARAGVPAIAFDHGLDYVDRPQGWGEERYREFVSRHYHQPSDSFRDDFDYRGAVQQARVMLRVAAAVAGARELPDWLPGSSFSRQ
ncbi:MAG TPA: M20/M25/M40 family metallo-hydrolase [Longimicrobiaceae bacterium]|nr:M20/M25/M40 family metallo-hydrolase [Longimicrobiaceae bacterium]